jgi:hypothetical protein
MRDDFIINYFGNEGDETCGAFEVPYKNYRLLALASSGASWDHVSVSLKKRIPSWEQMNFIKDLFFYEEETVMQLHPPKSQYVDNCSNCLHLWRPHDVEIPLPPSILVGFKL